MRLRHLEVGTFGSVKYEADVDFMKRIGVPEEQADKMLGTHHHATNVRVHGGWLSYWSVEEWPEMNTLEFFPEGQDIQSECPLYLPESTGRARVSSRMVGDNQFRTVVNTDPFGEMIIEASKCKQNFKIVLYVYTNNYILMSTTALRARPSPRFISEPASPTPSNGHASKKPTAGTEWSKTTTSTNT